MAHQEQTPVKVYPLEYKNESGRHSIAAKVITPPAAERQVLFLPGLATSGEIMDDTLQILAAAAGVRVIGIEPDLAYNTTHPERDLVDVAARATAAAVDALHLQDDTDVFCNSLGGFALGAAIDYGVILPGTTVGIQPLGVTNPCADDIEGKTMVDRVANIPNNKHRRRHARALFRSLLLQSVPRESVQNLRDNSRLVRKVTLRGAAEMLPTARHSRLTFMVLGNYSVVPLLEQLPKDARQIIVLGKDDPVINPETISPRLIDLGAEITVLEVGHPSLVMSDGRKLIEAAARAYNADAPSPAGV